jgi:hypothetical protein
VLRPGFVSLARIPFIPFAAKAGAADGFVIKSRW